MATVSENASIAVLQTQVGTIQSDVLDVKRDMREIKDWVVQLENRYVTRDEFKAFKSAYWLSHTLTALITASITSLVYYFITHGHFVG